MAESFRIFAALDRASAAALEAFVASFFRSAGVIELVRASPPKRAISRTSMGRTLPPSRLGWQEKIIFLYLTPSLLGETVARIIENGLTECLQHPISP